jgi:hypothetical protein
MIGVGIAVLLNLKRLGPFIAKTQRATFGDASRPFQPDAAGKSLIAPGVGAIVIGVVAVVMVVVAPDSF